MITAAQREYRQCYLPSAHWRQFRDQWWAEHPHAVCTDCGASHPRPDLHHLTYARRGREDQADVVPLCRACHDARHGRRRGVARRLVALRPWLRVGSLAMVLLWLARRSGVT